MVNQKLVHYLNIRTCVPRITVEEHLSHPNSYSLTWQKWENRFAGFPPDIVPGGICLYRSYLHQDMCLYYSLRHLSQPKIYRTSVRRGDTSLCSPAVCTVSTTDAGSNLSLQTRAVFPVIYGIFINKIMNHGVLNTNNACFSSFKLGPARPGHDLLWQILPHRK